jgi:uncharacterized paraquat-inducible protein A
VPNPTTFNNTVVYLALGFQAGTNENKSQALEGIMTCEKCGTNNESAAFCSGCGTALATAPAPSYSAPPAMTAKAPNTLSTIALVLAAVGFLFFPIVIGTASLVLGIVAKSKREPNANIAITAGIVSLVGGMILGAIIGASITI